MSNGYSPLEQHGSHPDAQDTRLPLALIVGLVAALVGGAIWAVIVRLTNFEVGYVAWGVGLLVGAAISRVTPHRGKTLAAMAAGLAVVGLLIGKAFIFYMSAGTIAKEIAGDTAAMEGAMAWQMYETRELDPATLDSLDARMAAQDTISDALWSHMREQSAARLQGMNNDRKAAFAKLAAQNTLRRMGLVNGVMGQFSGFDVLWVFLAIGTAYRMLAQGKSEDETVPAHAGPPAQQ